MYGFKLARFLGSESKEWEQTEMFLDTLAPLAKTGHANLIGLDSERFITTIGHRLKVLHIHDNDGRQDLHQIPFTFTATRENKSSTDWEGFIRGLRGIRFDGTLNFETAPVLSAFPEEMKETVLRFIAQIGKHFAQEIDT